MTLNGVPFVKDIVVTLSTLLLDISNQCMTYTCCYCNTKLINKLLYVGQCKLKIIVT